MQKKLPARPNLDHLRRQAKSLLADLAASNPDAIKTFQNFLPAAKHLSPEQVARSPFRLADAQSAIARKHGFAAWPHLARHIDLLRSLEGTWTFSRLDLDGISIPAASLKASRLLIDGDRFRTETPEGCYEGQFNIDVEAQPHQIDIEFVEGPEAGNHNYGIVRLEKDQLELCLDLHGRQRPAEFASSHGSGHAYEILTRSERSRPPEVHGGTPPLLASAPTSSSASGFDYVESPTLTRLQGEWSAVKIIREGMELPWAMLRTAKRVATRNEVQISFGGKAMIHAQVRLDDSSDPMTVDYSNVGGVATGTLQLGLFRWDGETASFCMGAPGGPRPDNFQAPPGSGRTFSQWKRKR